MRNNFVQVQKLDLADGEELMDLAKKVMAAITHHKGRLNKYLALQGIFNDHIVVRDMEDGRMFRMSMKRDDAGSISLDGMEEVRQVFVPARKAAEKAVWSAAFINDLPDSSFLYIEPGGKKDDDGKTVPRSLRHFPVKDADGKPDLPHVRNALARIPQSSVPQAVKDRCMEQARKMLEAAQAKMEKAAIGTQVVTLPELMVVIEDGKLDPDSVEMLEEVAKVAALPAEDFMVMQVSEESLWRGVI